MEVYVNDMWSSRLTFISTWATWPNYSPS